MSDDNATIPTLNLSKREGRVRNRAPSVASRHKLLHTTRNQFSFGEFSPESLGLGEEVVERRLVSLLRNYCRNNRADVGNAFSESELTDLLEQFQGEESRGRSPSWTLVLLCVTQPTLRCSVKKC